MKRAVITGLGIVSSIGNNQQEVLASLQAGRSGITFSPEFEKIAMRSRVWGNVKLDTTDLIDRKISRFMSDASVYAYLSMQEAIADSGLTEPQVSHHRSGLVVGSGGGSPRSQVAAADGMRARGQRGVGPYMVTKSMASGVSACLATPFKIKGVNYSISSACATSAHCIGHALELIQLGKQDVVFAGVVRNCAGKWPANLMRWAPSRLSITVRQKKLRVLMISEETVLLSQRAAVWWWSKNWRMLWHGVLIFMLKSLVTAQRLMVPTWLLPPVKVRCVV